MYCIVLYQQRTIPFFFMYINCYQVSTISVGLLFCNLLSSKFVTGDSLPERYTSRITRLKYAITFPNVHNKLRDITQKLIPHIYTYNNFLFMFITTVFFGWCTYTCQSLHIHSNYYNRYCGTAYML